MAQRHTVSHLGGVDTQLENLDPPAANQPRKTSGGGLSITSEQRSAAVYRICVTSSLLASDGAGTVSTTRVTESDSDQLINCSVINALFGTMISLRSQSLMVVARVLILGDAAGEIADGHRITNSNRLFKQNDQTRNEVGKNLL